MTMLTATIAAQIPYAEMTLDSIDPSGWMASLDIVCDGDREVVVLLSTEEQDPIMLKKVKKP